MARKRTKAEALERLGEAAQRTPPGLKGRAKIVRDAAFLGAAGLIMLDPLNRLADDKIVLPIDMVAIPAYQAYLIQPGYSMQIYIRAGETIIPTGGNVDDVELGMMEAAGDDIPISDFKPARKRVTTAYQKKYKAAFKSLTPKYKLKSGKWKKDGFKQCVRAAHKKAGGKK